MAETRDQSTNCNWYNAQDEISTSINHSAAGALFTDWRLPTKNELNLLYMRRNNVGGFAINFYWSSTQNEDEEAWRQGFFTGRQSSSSKTERSNVRAVRAF